MNKYILYRQFLKKLFWRQEFGIILLLWSFMIMPFIFGKYPGTTVIPNYICFSLVSFTFIPYIYWYFTNKPIYTVNLYVLYCIFPYSYGIFFNTDNLTNAFSNIYLLFLYLFIYIGCIPNILISYLFTIKKFFFITLFLFSIFSILYYNQIPGYFNIQRYIYLLSVIPLFFPYINKKTCLLSLFIICSSIFIDTTIRAHLLNVLILIIAISFYIFSIEKIRTIASIILKFSFSIPIIFIIMSITIKFNIFSYIENIEIHNIKYENQTKELLVDSRTGVYEDAYSATKDVKDFIFGHGQFYKYNTFLSESLTSYMKTRTTGSSEVVIVNSYMNGGIIQCILLIIVYLCAAKNAIKKSRNKALLILSIWISLKQIVLYIDDKQFFSANIFIILFIIGLCYNQNLLRSTDYKLKKHLNRVF